MKSHTRNIRSWFFAVLGLVVLVPVIWILIVRLEGEKPAVTFQLPGPALGISQTFSVTVADNKSGLRSIWFGLLSGTKQYVLLQENFPGSGFLGGGDVEKESFRVTLEPRELGIEDGPATLRIVVRDFSWRGRLKGNQAVVEKPVIIDTKPPVIDILTRFHNVAQGGAALVIYRLSEACPKNGVHVEEDFYPGFSGYFKDPGLFMAFFALRYDQGRGTKMFVRATDAAGNRSVAAIPHYIIKKRFRKDKITLSDRFLSAKMPEFSNELPQASRLSPVEIFLKVNRDLRRESYKKIKELVSHPDSKMHWNGIFLRLPNSARKAGFADHRDYFYGQKKIDSQVHLGIDLASIARSKVLAANNGRIVFSDKLGIYGNTVIIDHGFGIFSMYSHLSAIQVQPGQMVSKGDIIGLTGSSGLAGGDHLHFSILIHHTFVNPVEWWDASWIENNVLSKIKDVETYGG
ncbi:MAG: M23 family metallopeptidase [Deltaproteobacteria bacterium]|nr:M23 family metallopeptidase [Deltaproteobacteria bacterium]